MNRSSLKRVLVTLTALALLLTAAPAAPALAATGDAGYDLAARLVQDKNDQQLLHFQVKNRSREAARLTFATAQEYELLLIRQGEVVWRASDDQMYAQVAHRQLLRRGERLDYAIELPELRAGTYWALAYLKNTSGTLTMASTSVVIEKAPRPILRDLNLHLRYDRGGWSWFNDDPRLIVSLHNPYDKEIHLTGDLALDMVIRNEDGRRVWARQDIYSGSRGDLGSKVQRTSFFNIPDLKAGRYTAEVNWHATGETLDRVSFSVR